MILNEIQMAEIKKIEVDMLREFVKICEKLNLQYYLIGGTLLGAIRHQGFIPWDDDIDIGMPRHDYEIFVEKAGELFSDPFFLQNYRTDSYMIFPFSKLRNSNTTYIEKRSKYSKMNQGVWIDIFPLDYYEQDNFKRKAQAFSISLINMRIGEEQFFEDKRERSLIKKALRNVFLKLLRIRFPNLQDAVKRIDRIYASSPKSNILVNKCGAYPGKEEIPEEWFGVGCKVIFENMELNAPIKYDQYLSHIYGDYMSLPPEEKQITVHNIEIIDFKKSYKEYIS